MRERVVPGPYRPEEMAEFPGTYMNRVDGFLLDEVLPMDVARREIEARRDRPGRFPTPTISAAMRGTRPTSPAAIC